MVTIIVTMAVTMVVTMVVTKVTIVFDRLTVIDHRVFLTQLTVTITKTITIRTLVVDNRSVTNDSVTLCYIAVYSKLFYQTMATKADSPWSHIRRGLE